MSDTGDNLEDELRALLSRVLSGQLDGVTGKVAELGGSVGKLSNICRDLPNLPKKLGDLVAAQEELAEKLQGSVARGTGTLAQGVERLHGALAETRAAVIAQAHDVRRELGQEQQALAKTLQGSVAEGTNTLAQQVERVYGALAETRAAVSARAKEVQQDLVDAREVLATQSNVQAEALTGTVTRQIDALGLALNAVQQRVEEGIAALDRATVRLAQAVEETNTQMQSRFSELKHKIGLLTGLSITVIIVLVAAVASAGAIFMGAVAGRFGS
jgi:hypothetical protein